MIVGLLGVLKAGGAYLPLDPNDPGQRLHFIMEDARPRVLITQKRFLDQIPLFPPDCLLIDTEWSRVAEWDDEAPVSGVTSENLAYVIYTSGSTGAPKGVMVHSQAVTNHLLWMQSTFPLTGVDRVLQKYPFHFDASVCEIFGSLTAGACLVITEPTEHWDVSEFVRLLVQHRITHLDVLPSMLRVLLEEEGFRSCRSLRRVICGGEPLAADLRDRFFEVASAQLHNIYGPTEATVGATHWTCRPGQEGECVPIGRPIANTQVYVVDQWLNPVPIGVRGELCIGGDGVARGYLNRPELTAERFIHDPFSGKPNARLYRTGDLARYLPDGKLEYLGRMDLQVKLRGHRVEPAEVERTLARNKLVQDCVVLPVEDESGHRKLVAWVTPVPDEPEFWPSVGEYDVYDELLYYALAHDEGRNRAYQAAIQRRVKGKVVLDIGTGGDAILSRYCVEAGAERVYATELREDAWRRASELVENMGLANRIRLIHGDSTRLQLPEKVDVCVSQILGTIGSSEGVIPVLNDARRFLREGGVMIPRRCVTRLAAVSLPEELTAPFRLNELPGVYVRRIFDKHGHPFDLRMCIKNFPPRQTLSQPQVFEALDFTGLVDPDHETEVTCRIERDSRLDGFLLWLSLCPCDDEWIDSLHHRLSSLPVFFPVFYPGVAVSAGDMIEARCSRRASADAAMPDYEINGVLIRQHGEPVRFTYRSPHRTSEFRKNPFYECLFSGMNGLLHGGQIGGEYTRVQPESATHGLVPNLRRYLQEQLPEYMIPSSFVVLSELPRTPNGKIDQRALPKPGRAHRDGDGRWATPGTEVERIIMDVWRELLDVEEVGPDRNFFDLGGDSLLISSVRSRLERLLKKQVSIVDLFRYPTVRSLARFVEEREPQTDLFERVQDRARMQLGIAGSGERRMGVSGDD
jgi:amino acid adenylation domain-containing protein